MIFKKTAKLIIVVQKGAGPNDLQEHMATRCYVFGAELFDC